MLRRRPFILALLALAAVPGAASASGTSTGSLWSGDVRIETTIAAAHEEVEYGGAYDGEVELEGREQTSIEGRHLMAGKFHGLFLPRRAGSRPLSHAGIGNLRHWPGTWTSRTATLVGGTTTREKTCHGVLRNLDRPDTMIGFAVHPGRASRDVRIDVHGLHLVSRDARCTPDDTPDEGGPSADGWPEDFAVPLPPDPHDRPVARLAIDRWAGGSSCGEEPDRSGTGPVPPPARATSRIGECTGRSYTLRHVTIELRRVCRTYRVRKVSRTGTRGRCVRRR
jgi:hypothetical protein